MKNTKILKSKLLIAFLLILLTLFIPILNFADGIIIPIEPIPDRPIGHNPIHVTYHNVQMTCDENHLEVVVEQEFYNKSEYQVEGKYIFPVPKNATVSDFTMIAGDKKYDGKVMDKDKAKQIYTDIVRQMKDPALLEYLENDLLQLSIFPFQPWERRKTVIKYVQSVKPDYNVYKLVYPFRIEKLAGGPLSDVAIDLKIKMKGKIKDVYTPYFDIEKEFVNENYVKVSYRAKDIVPKNDFVIFALTGDKSVDISVLANKKEAEDGYFMMTLAPDIFTQEDEILPKNVVFVLDTSGSMAGRKIEQAKEALNTVLSSLNEEDRFNIITFSTFIEKYNATLENASKVSNARKFVNDIEAGGGTNIYEALDKAFQMLTKYKNENNFVLFLTDGKPTSGKTSIRDILQMVKTKNRGYSLESRVFVFGVGYDVNTELLDTVSEENGGKVSYVIENESIEDSVSRLAKTINAPLLSDVEIDVNGVRTSKVHPKRIFTLFKGSQVRVFGQYDRGGIASVMLKGKKNNKPVKYTYKVNFPREEQDNFFVQKLWASKRIADLISSMRLYGENQETKDEIIDLSVKYGVINSYTSYLILDNDEYIARGGRDDDSPLNRDGFSTLRKEAEEQAMDFEDDYGRVTTATGGGSSSSSNRGNVKMSKDLAEDKEKMTLSDEKNKVTARDKIFIKNGDVFVDISFENKNVITIKAYSEAYFQLIEQYPEISQYLSVGQNVKFKYKEYNIFISENAGIENANTLLWQMREY